MLESRSASHRETMGWSTIGHCSDEHLPGVLPPHLLSCSQLLSGQETCSFHKGVWACHTSFVGWASINRMVISNQTDLETQGHLAMRPKWEVSACVCWVSFSGVLPPSPEAAQGGVSGSWASAGQREACLSPRMLVNFSIKVFRGQGKQSPSQHVGQRH